MKTIGLIFVSCVAALQGETFVVTSIADEGAGSLREAISLANETPAIDLIVFSEGEEGSINFSDGVPRVIQIASTLSVTQSLEIVGPGKTLLAIDGGGDGDFLVESGEVRVFSFAGSTVAEPHRVTDLTIRNGTSILGGANIRVFGSLELVRCEISGGRGVAANPSVNGNTTENADGGGVFHSQGPMLVEACEIFENGTIGNFSQGGGLYSENGSLTIRGSRIFSNTTNGAVSEGGGLGLRSTTVLEDSEVSDNETLASSSGGGGVYTDDEFLARNTTFSGNVVGAATGIQGYSVGGAFASVGFGNAAFEACTIVDNRAPSGTGQGGGISTFSRGQISFFSTILIGNDAVDLERIPNAITRFIDRGYNLFGIGSGFDLIEERQATSVYGVSSDEGILDVLDFYGGPTRSHRLSVGGSNTIDFGPTRSIYEAETGEAAFFDQRGVDFPRSSGERLDVGAYEFQTFLDRDNDGLPDAVEEIVEGLNPDLPDAELDLDGDGIRNYDEYVQLGILAINDRERFLRPSISSLTGFEEVQLNFQTSPNREYRLRFGEGLSEELMTEQTDFLRFLGESKGAITIPVSEERMFFRVESRIPEELLDNSL